MYIQETEWTVGAWRNLLTRRFREAKELDPASHDSAVAEAAEVVSGADKTVLGAARSSIRGSRAKPIQDQALVMTIIGTIHSDNCNFHAALNATALRTDWEATTAKAINYSMYMTLVCLTQMLVLLRQLLHSQSQSAATRVSLLCVGWQTVIDALMCLVHIYLSLAMQPLFTAFASVAFFKLLIFCVIEMKVRFGLSFRSFVTADKSPTLTIDASCSFHSFYCSTWPWLFKPVTAATGDRQLRSYDGRLRCYTCDFMSLCSQPSFLCFTSEKGIECSTHLPCTRFGFRRLC